jgi:hypothetical protein
MMTTTQSPSATQILKRISSRRVGIYARRSRIKSAGTISVTCRAGMYGGIYVELVFVWHAGGMAEDGCSILSRSRAGLIAAG